MHVITRLGLGGAERIAETIATNMTADGTASIIVPVAAYRDEVMATAMLANLERRGVEVGRGGASTSARRAAFQAVSALVATVEAWRPDVVHLHTEIPEFTWALTTIRSQSVRDLPVVRTIHNTILWGGWPIAGRFAERRLAKGLVVAVSHAASDAFVAWRKGSVEPPVVIYNGVDDVYTERQAGIHRPPVLCFAGRFEAQKGIDVMLDAIPLIEHPFRLLVFGSGSMEAQVASTAQELPDRMVLSEPIPELRHRFAEFDAILMPSRFEGLSNLAVEALYAGVPLLATDAPGLSEATPDWYPGQCPTDDPVAFAGMVDAFLAAPETWAEPVARASLWARERFSAAAMVEGYRGFYQAAIARRPGPD